MTDDQIEDLRFVISIGHANPKLIRPDKLLSLIRKAVAAIALVSFRQRGGDTANYQRVESHGLRMAWSLTEQLANLDAKGSGDGGDFVEFGLSKAGFIVADPTLP
ncbi:hypothetical protein [Rhodanobacter sp. LX-100]|uniref:hypothetical protein n=1 Tax=Rhodanobacter sp. LX-100 TaxID=2838835 RepID=UPI0020326A58|nr:hypothetical protein [Rhodanobacter sp. LX-100]